MSDLPPDIAHENAVNDLKEKYAELKRLTASILVRRDQTAGEVEQARAELAGLEARVGGAVSGAHDNEALALLQQKQATEARLASLVDELEASQGDIDAAKESLAEIKAGIERLRVERPRAVAAEARDMLAAQLDDIAPDATAIALENARENIKATIAMVDLNRELGLGEAGRPVGAGAGRAVSAPRPDPEAEARRQLEELKRQRAGGGAPRPKKTL